MRDAFQAGWRRCCEAGPLVQDALLYAASAVFCLFTALVALSSDYRQWGAMAGGAYALAGAVCIVAWRRDRRQALRTRAVAWIRRGVVVFLLLGAVLAPLVAELTWRAQAQPGSAGHAQPEVAVIERAGDRAAKGLDPYLTHPTQVGIPPASDRRSIDRSSFFPYLPGMVPFGLLNAASVPNELRDARVVLAGFTLVVGAAALIAADASLGRRGRVLQFLVVLPSGALPMVTGGDDLPVLALLLAGLLLAGRRRPLLAGLVIGLAGSLKFTAWPLLVLLAFGVRDREGRPAALRYLVAVAAVVVPVVGAGFAASPAAFVENVVRFPLGLTKVHSPAASPLVGQVLVHALPHHKAAVTALLVLVGAVVSLAVFIRYRPRTPAAVARFTAFVMAAATVLAPATRFGYLIYPANLFVWAYLLDGLAVPSVPGDGDQPASPFSRTRRETVLVGALSPLPESAGVIEGVAGSTATPTSQ